MSNRLIRSAAVIAVAMGLVACSENPVPTVEPVPSPTQALPALDEESLASILEETSAVLTEADAVSSVEALSARFTGPAEILRSAEYQVAAASEGASPAQPLTVTPQLSIVSASFDWPRVVTVVSEIPMGANLPILYTMVQKDPRSDFKVWAYVRLFPGLTLPQTEVPSLGSDTVAPDSADLLVSPTEVLARYADVVSNGDESEHAALFAADPFRAGWDQVIGALSEAIADAGTVVQTAAPAPPGTVSIGTADGGAIVLGAIDQTTLVERTEEDSTLTVGDNLSYYGENDVAGSLTTRFYLTVAFYVPPAGSEAQVQVLGAEQIVLGADRDDSTNPD